jgi:hypothetical protein
MGLDIHIRGDRGVAGSHERTRAFHLYHACPTGTGRQQTVEIAKGGNVYAVPFCQIQNGYSRRSGDLFAIQFNCDISHLHLNKNQEYRIQN